MIVLKDGSFAVFETYMVTLTGDFGGEQNFCSYPLKEIAPLAYTEFDKKWEPIWKESCEVIQNTSADLKAKHSIPSILFYLFWRIGREAGTVMRGR